MLDLLIRYLPEDEAPRRTAITVVVVGSLVALVFAMAVERYVDDAIRIAPFTPAILVAALFGGRSAGFAALLLNTALASAVLRQQDPGLTLGTFAFQLVFSAATFAAGDALRIAVRQLIARQHELLEREKTLATLVEELDHRSKNMLAVVQLLSRQTAATAADPKTFDRVFQSRVAALGRAQSMMIKAHWRNVALDEIVATALAPFGAEAAGAGLHVDGGPPAPVDGRCALGLALTLHELATNAGKYGALSLPGGQARVGWTQETDGRIRLSWDETGGPPVTAPTRKGFGGALVARMLQPFGEPRFDYRAEGLRFSFRFAPGEVEPS